MTSKPQKADPIQPAKKPYQAPQLEVYGDLNAITQSASSTGVMNDGGAMPMNKT